MKYLIILLLVPFISTAQEETSPFKNDISLISGIGFGYDAAYRKGIMYRRYLNDKWRLKISANHYQYHSYNPYMSNIAYSSDTLIIFREVDYYHPNYQFKAGADRTIGKYFFVGAELILGFRKNQQVSRDSGLKYDTLSNEWQPCADCVWEYHDDGFSLQEVDPSTSYPASYYIYEVQQKRYFAYGASINIGAQYHFNPRFSVAVQYNPDVVFFEELSGNYRFARFQNNLEGFFRVHF